MSAEKPLTLSKKERLCSRKLIEQLFSHVGSHTQTSYPLRAVAMTVARVADDVPVEMMVSVSKRYFKRALHRNRIKRQVREAYRKNKYLLADKIALQHPDETLCLAFVWIGDKQQSSDLVERKVVTLLSRIAEKL